MRTIEELTDYLEWSKSLLGKYDVQLDDHMNTLMQERIKTQIKVVEWVLEP